uniref:Xaa-Pro aminopeptidase 2 n=1 Tax=Magallana gigas TaxID=29159 RepID=K1RPT8_MAGGI
MPNEEHVTQNEALCDVKDVKPERSPHDVIVHAMKLVHNRVRNDHHTDEQIQCCQGLYEEMLVVRVLSPGVDGQYGSVPEAAENYINTDNQYSRDFIPRESVHVKEGHCHDDQTKVNRLEDVRRLMHEKKLDAYIICNVNENLGKLKPHDRRLESISGFSGRIGTAVITLDRASLWTDGRTFQSAIDDVDCGWTIYRKGTKCKQANYMYMQLAVCAIHGGSNSTSLVDWVYDNTVDGSSVGACPYLTSLDVREYNPSRFKDDVSKASRDNCVRKVWVSWSCSEAFAEEIPQEKLILDHTPPMALKAAKNGAELEGIMNSTLRDSVFLTTYFAGLEKRMKNGDTLITKDLEVEIKQLRHDGTTDIARCFVFGTPNERQKVRVFANVLRSQYHGADIYTRLLMTQINLAMKTFEAGTTGRDLDSDEVREPLREIGVHFPHEIGHMLAAHGAIVEGPALISNITEDWRSDVPRDRHIFECRKCKKPQDVAKIPNWSEYVLEEGMVFSNEPSFYGKGEFGMRLENTMFITTGQCEKPCFAFRQLVFLPYEPNLIKPELFSDHQKSWLKDYHGMIEQLVIPQLQARNDSTAIAWLLNRTNAKINRLREDRKLMLQNHIDAYIVCNENENLIRRLYGQVEEHFSPPLVTSIVVGLFTEKVQEQGNLLNLSKIPPKLASKHYDESVITAFT